MYHAAGGQTLLTPLAPLEDWKEFFVGLGEMMFQACQGFYKWFYRKKKPAFGYSMCWFCVFCFIKETTEDAVLYVLCQEKRFC